MSEPFIGEIRTFAGNFAPVGWALCNGQLLAINRYSALFSILGLAYGGDGRTTFGLPNLQGNAPMHWGNGPGLTPREIGDTGGSTSVTLTTAEMPAHTHPAVASLSGATASSPAGAALADAAIYADPPLNERMAAVAVTPAGGSQPHNNMQPHLAVTFIIALEGIYPSRG